MSSASLISLGGHSKALHFGCLAAGQLSLVRARARARQDELSLIYYTRAIHQVKRSLQPPAQAFFDMLVSLLSACVCVALSIPLPASSPLTARWNTPTAR